MENQNNQNYGHDQRNFENQDLDTLIENERNASTENTFEQDDLNDVNHEVNDYNRNENIPDQERIVNEDDQITNDEDDDTLDDVDEEVSHDPFPGTKPGNF